METLKSGCLAFIDSFTGLVPCKVLRVYHYSDVTGYRVDVEVTANRLGYPRGKIETFDSFFIVPRKATRKLKYGHRILPYEIQKD